MEKSKQDKANRELHLIRRMAANIAAGSWQPGITVGEAARISIGIAKEIIRLTDDEPNEISRSDYEKTRSD